MVFFEYFFIHSVTLSVLCDHPVCPRVWCQLVLVSCQSCLVNMYVHCKKYICRGLLIMKLQLTVCATEQWIYSTVICCMFRVREAAELSTTAPLKTQTYWIIGMMRKDTTVSVVKLVGFNP